MTDDDWQADRERERQRRAIRKDPTKALVARLPDCDICTQNGKQVPAYADAKLGAGMPWANTCRDHFRVYGCQLGLGKGQELIVE
jgi:hypothetical protein